MKLCGFLSTQDIDRNCSGSRESRNTTCYFNPGEVRSALFPTDLNRNIFLNFIQISAIQYKSFRSVLLLFLRTLFAFLLKQGSDFTSTPGNSTLNTTANELSTLPETLYSSLTQIPKTSNNIRCNISCDFHKSSCSRSQTQCQFRQRSDHTMNRITQCSAQPSAGFTKTCADTSHHITEHFTSAGKDLFQTISQNILQTDESILNTLHERSDQPEGICDHIPDIKCSIFDFSTKPKNLILDAAKFIRQIILCFTKDRTLFTNRSLAAFHLLGEFIIRKFPVLFSQQSSDICCIPTNPIYLTLNFIKDLLGIFQNIRQILLRRTELSSGTPCCLFPVGFFILRTVIS